MLIRILIADDHPVFRSGLKVLLERETDLEVVGETGNGIDTIAAVSKTDLNVLLLDLAMPGMPGSKVAEAVLKERPDIAIVVLTMNEDESYLQELLRIGVRGYVLKKSTGTDVVQAIRAASKGEQYIDPALAGVVISSYLGRKAANPKQKGLEIMTPRESEVLTLLAYGHTNGEIAEKLSISERTVESHRNNIMTKLEFRNRAELVRFAIKNGMLKLH